MAERFQNWQKPDIEDGKPTKWNWVVRHVEGFTLGKNTDIGAFTYIQAQEGVVIEDDVQIGAHCAIYSVSTIDNTKGKIVLKKNCRIGANSVILPGVTVGENAIVGAMSLVKEDVPANALVVGIPARIVKTV